MMMMMVDDNCQYNPLVFSLLPPQLIKYWEAFLPEAKAIA